MNYKRLTEADRENGIVASFANDAEILDRLAELEDKIENGTLIFKEKENENSREEQH